MKDTINNLKEEKKITKATYTRRCILCVGLEVYIMRDFNVNTNITDEQIPMVIVNKNDSEFTWCDICKQITKKELVAYNY